jgi:hypothetical protein
MEADLNINSTQNSTHWFHIPVMGIAFTIDSPIRVAPFGIDSVISIMDDEIIEQMRSHYSKMYALEFTPIEANENDARARRITEYLNLVHWIVNKRTENIKQEVFNQKPLFLQYISLLPDNAPSKLLYESLSVANYLEKVFILETIQQNIVSGSIDVNIMTKLDKTNYDIQGNPLPNEFTDASAALRGYANSKLHSSVIFSAGMNPRLFGYLTTFPDFFPDSNGYIAKKIILKVSDFRSASIQGKFLAKKGIWISEFRIESGLNCGGHAFATDGLLLGKIMEEFKEKRNSLQTELWDICNATLSKEQKPLVPESSKIKITVQGGIGTFEENKILKEHYGMDSLGWGSPFLLVPEATLLDPATLDDLSKAQPDDYYLSHASPLGVPFNNFRKSQSEKQKNDRNHRGKPGSPCVRKMLVFNTEFTDEPICTASIKYQKLKRKQLAGMDISEKERNNQLSILSEKECLCEGLCAPARVSNDLNSKGHYNAVAICPGPNLAYFSGIFSLKQMVDHIYGRTNLLNYIRRPNLFINELNLYIQYLENEIVKSRTQTYTEEYVHKFKNNLKEGIEYYRNLYALQYKEYKSVFENMLQDLQTAEQKLQNLNLG